MASQYNQILEWPGVYREMVLVHRSTLGQRGYFTVCLSRCESLRRW